MLTTPITVMDLFSGDIQYIIPLFQRHYVWDQGEQWAPLWEDIRDKARRRLSEFQRDRFSHFTGAIVTQQTQTKVNEVQKYEIIDGQQRLTTFQVILCALRDICKLYEFEDIEREAERSVLNQGMLLGDSADEKYKLIPTEFDKASFISLADRHIDDSSGQIRLTYDYFRDRIEEYVNRDQTKMRTLFLSISNDFGFVQILLDAGDGPERIFESLNARGKHLLQFDLLRNNLFLRARADRDRLYEDYWKHFENPYWEEKIARKTLSELFFQHFLVAKLGESKVTPLFNVYQRRFVRDGRVADELFELKRYSEVYKEMIDCSPNSEIGQAMAFYKTFEITTLYPFILFLVNELQVSGSNLSGVLKMLESYTMRRVVCGTSRTQSYTKLVSSLIQKMRGQPFDLETFRNLLADEKADATRWPKDNEVGMYLKGLGINNRRDIRYVLYRIELKKREENQSLETNDLVFDHRLNLEHIMPEAWQNTWHLPLATEENGEPSFDYDASDCDVSILYENLFHSEYRENNSLWQTEPSEDGLAEESHGSAFSVANRRRDILQSIGNLTLVTGSLNSRLSNRPFSEKKARLFQNSLLVLNKEICENDSWDLPQIEQRATDLFDYFRSIWPSA